MIEIDSNERILRIVRKHWFILVSDLFLLIACLAVPVVLAFALQIIPFNVFFAFSGSTLFAQGFFLLCWLFIVWMLGWELWTNYYLDVLIITDKRIFAIEQDGLFKRTSSSFRIDRVQNTTVKQTGVLQTLFGFGTIHIETAGENEEFVGTFVADPYEIKKFINDMQDAALDTALASAATLS